MNKKAKEYPLATKEKITMPLEVWEAKLERITELEALLKTRDGEEHTYGCDTYGVPPRGCTCGHDAVAKYFEGVGK